jgi:hypothetical protein
LGLSVFDSAFRVHVKTSVETNQPVIGVIVDAPQSQLNEVAQAAKVRGIRASVAVDQPPGQATVAAILSTGSEPIPRLRKSGAFRWIATKSRLKKLVANLGLSRPFAYQPPGSGFSLGEYEAAKSVGGKPVRGKVVIDSASTIGELQRGEIVQVTISQPGDYIALDDLKLALARQHLTAQPVSSLLKR